MSRSLLARTGEPLPDAEWDLFRTRARTARGKFVVGVVTTGIYCAPDCPAKSAKRENLRRFGSWTEAEGSGFRACLRCDPKGAASADVPAEAVRSAILAIEAAEAAPALVKLANRAGYSPFHFLRLFKAHTGLTPAAYARAVKARRLRDGLAQGHGVLDAAFAAGYGAASRAYRAAPGALGMAPGQARRGGAGETIRIASTRSAFGPLLVGATERGICFVGFAEPEESLRADLARRFPAARLVEDDAALADLVRQVLAVLEEPSRGAALPLDLRGTAFQMRVWEALASIPPGSTRTYAQLAESIGSPKAVRAVGTACGANPVAVLVPCHRAVGSDGTLHGYRWGLARKRALLDAERK